MRTKDSAAQTVLRAVGNRQRFFERVVRHPRQDRAKDFFLSNPHLRPDIRKYNGRHEPSVIGARFRRQPAGNQTSPLADARRNVFPNAFKLRPGN